MTYDNTTAFLQEQAARALLEAQNNASRIYSLPPQVNTRDPSFSVNLVKPDIGPPPAFDDVLQGSDSTESTLVYLNEQSDKWIQKYFPSISGSLRNIPDDWLAGVVSGVKPFGIDKTIFELVWHNARDRAYRTRASEVRTIDAEFSSRGFSLVPGAMVDAITQAEQRASDAILEVNVQEAIKDAQIKNELLQFAVNLSATYKLGIMDSLVNYYRTWITAPDKDIERARIKAQAMSALYSALSTYYNVEISFEELRLRAASAGADIDLGVDRNTLARQGNFGATASALGQAVSSFANIAAQSNAAGGTLSAQIEAL